MPRYLDLAAYRDAARMPCTQSSNLSAALDAALAIDSEQRRADLREADESLRKGLRRNDLVIVADDGVAMPGIITLAPPADPPAARLAQRMQRQGYLLAWRSAYLERRNWIQICLLGECNRQALDILSEVLATQALACKARVSVDDVIAESAQAPA